MTAKWKSRLFDILLWTGFALLMVYGLPLSLGLSLIIGPMLALLVFWTVHEWAAVRRRRENSDLP